MRIRDTLLLAGAIAGAVGLVPAAGAAAPSFPDVPPWHWASAAVMDLAAKGIVVGYPAAPAELAENAIAQVYDGFLHSSAPGSGPWVERFTYNRPAAWPAPEPPSYVLRHVPIASYALTGMHVRVNGDQATAVFTSTVVPIAGSRSAETTAMRVRLRFNGQDWQIDYATLAAGSPVFR